MSQHYRWVLSLSLTSNYTLQATHCCRPLCLSFSLCRGHGNWHGPWAWVTLKFEVLPATFSPPDLLRLFHPPLSPVVFFFQSPSSPAFFTSLFTQSSHLSLGPPHLLLPCSRNSAALFGSLLSAILSTWPAHCNLLLTSLSVQLLCTPVSSLNSTILRLSALVTLAIFFSDPVVFAHLQPSFVVVVRSVPSFPFRTGMPVWHKCSWPCPSVFLRSAGPPSLPQLLSTHSLRPELFDIPLSPSSRLRTLPLLGTRNCPVGSVSSPPARCPALPFGGLRAALPSSLDLLSFSPCSVNKPFHSSIVSCSSCLPFATRARSSAYLSRYNTQHTTNGQSYS